MVAAWGGSLTPAAEQGEGGVSAQRASPGLIEFEIKSISMHCPAFYCRQPLLAGHAA